MATAALSNIEQLLGSKAESLLSFKSPKIAKERLHLPGPDFIDRIYALTDRNVRVLTNLQRLFGTGRLGKTGYLSILPVDQASSTRPAPASPRIPIISTAKISSSSPSKAAATLSPPPSASSAPSPANTRTKFPSS